MATYNVAAGENGAWEKTLVATVVDTVSFATDLGAVEVLNESTTTGLYFTVDGSTPTVGAAAGWYCPPSAVKTVQSNAIGVTTVKLISSGAPKYGVGSA